MELKIVTEDVETKKPKDTSGDFPIDGSWKEETTKHLKMAYDVCAKGDGPDAMEACDMIQRVIDTIKEEDNSESEDMISGMKKAKSRQNDYMDSFQDSESDVTE